MGSQFDPAQAIADAVLYEGYALYPYRASSAKNRARFQFGVGAPLPWATREGSERWRLSTECIAEYDRDTRLHVRVRFLHMPTAKPDPRGWDEAVEQAVEVTEVAVNGPLEQATPFTTGNIDGRVVVRAEPLPGPYPLTRLHVSVENLTSWDDARASRDVMLHRALLSTQVLLALHEGVFFSAIDPPAFTKAAVDSCTSDGLWPVLAGPGGGRDVMLCAPIILYDHPEVAPQSTTEFCDGTEIDEMLAIRVLTMTDDEKAEALATDPRTREIVERWGDFPPELIEKLHGVTHFPTRDGADADPSTDTALVVGGEVAKGSKVRLQPRHRADAQDLFVVGSLATVTGVFHDLDGETHVAVTLDDDPGADLHEWYGRYLYFKPDEVEAVAPA
ncbi:MAG: hypothetical protein JOZ37_12275 [Actinobacteria bacterium]|nr:hypothetical protein [Actinomycetota bacterium]